MPDQVPDYETHVMFAVYIQDLLDIAADVADGTNPALELAAYEVATNNGQLLTTDVIPDDFPRDVFARMLS